MSTCEQCHSGICIPDLNLISRELLERVVETLIGHLDRLDGDPDVEDSGDAEPPLGWATIGAQKPCGDVPLIAAREPSPPTGWVSRCISPPSLLRAR